MLPSGKNRILIADHELFTLASLIGTLKDVFHIVTVSDGKSVIDKLEAQNIDLILTETRLPDMSGFELCRSLKSVDLHKDIPIIFISSQSSVSDEAKGFEVGAVDYISKPFNAPTVMARIKNQLKLSSAIQELQRLNQLALDANPKTGLPGNNSIINELKKVINNNEAVSVIYADLDNFKAYNDVYGFAQGDEIISFTANVLRVAVQASNAADSFIGHIGGDDFVIIVPADRCCQVAEEIIRRIDRGIREFYRPDDIARGHLITKGRSGQEKQFPLIGLSMGAVDLSRRKLNSAHEIIDICTETKQAAKSRKGSNLYLDQRRDS